MSAYADQRVLVVGGTSGVGLAAAREFVTQGADTVIASRSPQRLDAALAVLGGLTASGGGGVPLSVSSTPADRVVDGQPGVRQGRSGCAGA
ncbi:SDR family NAD(P)-dependent oxidoreductase, partial [Streptomyces mirabilis]